MARHPELDPHSEHLLRIASKYGFSYNQAELAWHLFCNIDFSPTVALSHVAHAAEKALGDKNQFLMNPFWPFAGKAGAAQEMADLFLEIRKEGMSPGTQSRGQAYLDSVVGGPAHFTKDYDTKLPTPEEYLESKAVGTLIEMVDQGAGTSRIYLKSAFGVVEVRAMWAVPWTKTPFYEDMATRLFPMVIQAEGQALPIGFPSQLEGYVHERPQQ